MCGIVAILGAPDAETLADRALAVLHHRGPDAHGVFRDGSANVALGHARLSIIDLSDAAQQPMVSADGRYVIVFNGELYNYVELRRELHAYPYRSRSDTEVVLAAWSTWGERSLDRFIGMFAFVMWDRIEQRAIAVRDRFGVKPLYAAELPRGGLVLASEIKGVHAAGVAREPDPSRWASFLVSGVTDQGRRTFWRGIETIPAGTITRWNRDSGTQTERWYSLAARVGDALDDRPLDTVKAEYRALVEESVRLRFRSDVPVGINLSGGLDSSLLLGVVHRIEGADSRVNAFTFTTGDQAYDELSWVQGMLARTQHRLVECRLTPAAVPDLAAKVSTAEDEPFGGVPTLAYANLFARARELGTIVLLDGQGIDEQWAGYDYYRMDSAALVQGSSDPAFRPDCVSSEFSRLAETWVPEQPFPDRLRNTQLRDATRTKLPRALRYNDRISMAASTELREPFLDHRLFELAFRQPADRKIRGDTGKWLVRELASELLPDEVRLAPKRAVQTPQREWLRGPLASWANDLIERAFRERADWFEIDRARAAWQRYRSGVGDNSYWVWQWLSIGLLL